MLVLAGSDRDRELGERRSALAKEFRVDVSKPREPHLSECPTLVQSTEYKRKRRNDKNTRAMQRTTPCTSPGLSSAATARRCNKKGTEAKRKITGKT